MVQSVFSDGPVVKTQHFQCRGHGFIPGRGTRILNAARCSRKKKKGTTNEETWSSSVYRITIRSSNSGYLLKKNWNQWLRYLYTNIQRIIYYIHINQQEGTIQVFINKWMDKQMINGRWTDVVCIYNGIFLAIRKNELLLFAAT